MPEREQRVSARKQTLPRGTALTLAVYHHSAEVERHIALLRRSRHVRVRLVKQDAAVSPSVEPVGILWELSENHEVNRRRLPRILGRVPAASFGSAGARELADLSRTLGFRHHLTAPL